MIETNYRKAISDYLLANAKPIDKWSHQPRLYALACSLAEQRPFDDDVLFAAAYLHDIGVFIGHRPEDPVVLANWDNLAYAIEKVPGLLSELGFPSEKISMVIDVIRTHLPSGKPTTFEGTLLRDADILEQLGAITILRTVSKVGRDTRFTKFSDAVYLLRRNAGRLPGLLELASARQNAAERVKVLEGFLDAAEKESFGIEL
jgi:uncharacterized protein